MDFRIEGNTLTFEVSAESDGISCEALIRLDGGAWKITRPYGTTWLAEGRALLPEVIRRALQMVQLDLVNAQIKARTGSAG
jgi:hypothetical protein